MTTEPKGLRWGVERRLEFIEFRLFWEGGVNRSDIVDEFGVSVPQASKDLTLYQEQAGENIRYDRSQKRYFASEVFQPKFIAIDPSAHLERLSAATVPGHDGWISTVPHADKLPIPQRCIDPGVLRTVLDSVRNHKSIEVLYQSMSTSRPDPVWRRISAHAFGSDGLRWHARAFCHIDRKFKDFILSRCLDARKPGEADALPGDDRFWTEHFSVLLRPNPRLSKGQQHVIAQDFAMKDGEIPVSVRRALLYYFNKRLRLDMSDAVDDPRESPVIVKNRHEFRVALSEAMQ
jgi:predicted DNA-binding transcriptional regulator YafY